MGIGRKFQTPSIYSSHTVYDNLLLSLNHTRGILGTLFYKLNTEDEDKINEVLKTINLSNAKSTSAGLLSHGQKQWLEIGMLLAQELKILLIDEPAAGMRYEETVKTGELLPA